MNVRRMCSLVILMGVASSAGAFSIKPGAQAIQVAGGKSMKVKFEIVNDQKETLHIAPLIKDSFILPENKTFGAATWLEPLFKEVTVPGGTTKTVYFMVKAPAKASGELAALVSFVPQIKEPEKKEAPKEGIQTRIVTLITVSLYVRIKGTEKGEADVLSVQVRNLPATSHDEARIEAAAVVKNSGNVHQRPSGHFEIYKKGETKPLKTLDFVSGWPVMPQSEYAYSAFTNGTLEAGDYEMRSKISFGPQASIDKKTLFSMSLQGSATNYVEIK